MSLPEVSENTIMAALQQVGIHQGDDLLVHAALQYLGRPIGGVTMYVQALRAVIGPQATIAVPAFNFAFAKGQDYDPLSTPSDGMGVFSEYIRQLPDSLRTPHPLQSLALNGPLAAELAALDTACAFDEGSPFSQLLDRDFKLLLLGAGVQAVSIVHYSEQQAAVPYRYWKDFTGRIKREDRWAEYTYRMFVRDRDLDPQLKLAPVQEALAARGLWHSVTVNFGQIAACRLLDFERVTSELLAADPWALVGNRAAIGK
jgi:aminoglycoside 3-N-acetyltransferase